MSETKPLPCPFCGGEANVVNTEPRLYRPSCNHPYHVVCQNCDLHFGYDEDYGGEFDTEEEAIAAWNTRKPIQKIMELLEEESKFMLYELEDSNMYAGVQRAIEIVKEDHDHGKSGL